MKKEFSNGELSIVWRPVKCVHSGVCVKTLPDVYDPQKKPWIQPDNATTEQLVRQVAACPSGSLTSYFLQNEQNGFFSENEEKKRYELKIDGRVAFIDYIKAKGNIYLTHTEVPPELGGKGIGSRMVLQALTDVKKQNLALIPLCPFVAGYLKKHPEWKELVYNKIKIG